MIKQDEIEILIVEDDAFEARLSIAALEEKNIANTIVHLQDGAAALDYVFQSGSDAGPETSKVILLDLTMPKIDGLEVLRRIKSDKKMTDIPIVIFTSSSLEAHGSQCYALGAKDYIVKPLHPDDYKRSAYRSVMGMLIYTSQILTPY